MDLFAREITLKFLVDFNKQHSPPIFKRRRHMQEKEETHIYIKTDKGAILPPCIKRIHADTTRAASDAVPPCI